MDMKTRVKRLIRTPFFTALYIVLRPFGKVSVSLDGTRAVFRFRSVEELARAWSFAGERRVFSELLQHVKPGDTVWDVGANVGTHAVIFAKKVGSEGNVVAFEPEPGTRSTLEHNIALNRLANVQVLSFALGGTDSQQTLFVDSRPGSGKHSLVATDGYHETAIEVCTGDSLTESLSGGIPNVVKIDVEGYELQVLKGMVNTLADQRCRVVFCEVHTAALEANGDDPNAVEEMLRSGGFTQFERSQRGDQVHLIALKA